MIKTSLFSLAALAAMATVSSASILNIAGPATPKTSVGDAFIPGGLLRLGVLTGAPASAAIEDIEAVFTEFGTNSIPAGGFTPNTFSSSTTNNAATEFNQQQVYIWVFDGATVESSTEHALFSVIDPDNPGDGNPWRYPDHVGNGTDATTITTSAATLANLDLSVTTDARVEGDVLYLQRIPEPSGALLAGLAGMMLVFRRRR